MASRMADSMAVVKRVQAAKDMGWRTEKVGDGYKIFNPRGQQWIIHMTYSDVRHALNNLVRDLENDGGLKIDEEKLQARRERQRAAKLAAEREAAERKADQIAAAAANQQKAVVKAAGPYLVEPEEPDLAWLTTPHPAPWMRWMYITPKIAQILYDDYNSDNRPISVAAGRTYAATILSRQWHLTHQGLAMDTRPMVQDAQHRLLGIIIAGEVDPNIKVPFAIFVGMPIENFKAIDEGRLRNAAQMLKKNGVGAPINQATVLKMVAAYDSAHPRDFVRQRMRTTEAFELFDTDPDGFREAANWGVRHAKKTRVTAGPLGAAYYLLRRANGADNPYVNAFLEGFAYNRKHNTTLVLPDDDPRKVLLSKFSNHRPAPIEAVLWIIHAWNNLARNHHPSYMRVSESTPVPEILVCKPGAGRPPRGLDGEV